jgi:hypothetical protein
MRRFFMPLKILIQFLLYIFQIKKSSDFNLIQNFYLILILTK